MGAVIAATISGLEIVHSACENNLGNYNKEKENG